MDTNVPKLRLLDRSALDEALDLASELFHRINRIIPPNQELPTVPPTCRVRDAIARMLKHGYSQIPVVQNSEVHRLRCQHSHTSPMGQTCVHLASATGCLPAASAPWVA